MTLDEILNDIEPENDYKKYRGKCKEYVDVLIAYDKTLTAVRGHYICPLWGKQAHWWAIKPDGTIVDPTVKQFPTKGIGAEYIPFNGMCICEQCGKEVPEAEAIPMGNYACCSNICAMRLVGV